MVDRLESTARAPRFYGDVPDNSRAMIADANCVWHKKAGQYPVYANCQRLQSGVARKTGDKPELGMAAIVCINSGLPK